MRRKIATTLLAVAATAVFGVLVAMSTHGPGPTNAGSVSAAGSDNYTDSGEGGPPHP